jgi:alpha-amylase
MTRNTAIHTVLLFLCISLVFAGNPEQWKGRTIYQLLTDRFARNDGANYGCSNLGNYCGGGYRGIINNLDYIQGMGFDAIWISPIIQNRDGGYHGYWGTNLYSLN